MAGDLSHRAVVLARSTVWRPTGLPQFCPWCEVRYDGPECPECGEPADEDELGQIVVAFTTNDGRRWVVWAVRGVDGRWEPERIRPAGPPGDELAVAS
jgi:hypothetical protein